MKYNMNMKSKLINIKSMVNSVGELGWFQNGDLDFIIKRIYFIKDVPENQKRGLHGHKELEQIIIPLMGSFEVKIINRFEEVTYILDNSKQGLYIPKMSWRELSNFSNQSCCLILASELYDPNDYIFNINDFMEMINT